MTIEYFIFCCYFLSVEPISNQILGRCPLVKWQALLLLVSVFFLHIVLESGVRYLVSIILKLQQQLSYVMTTQHQWDLFRQMTLPKRSDIKPNHSIITAHYIIWLTIICIKKQWRSYSHFRVTERSISQWMMYHGGSVIITDHLFQTNVWYSGVI